MIRSPNPPFNHVVMTLEDSTRIGSTSQSEGSASETFRATKEKEEASVIVEGVKVPDALPFLLRMRGILSATLEHQEDGRIKVIAPGTTRERLYRIIASLKGIQLAEAK